MFLKRKGRYDGPVVFVDGTHRALKRNGKPDYKRKLLWDAEQEVYLHWHGTGTDHLGLYHQREVELPIGGPTE